MENVLKKRRLVIEKKISQSFVSDMIQMINEAFMLYYSSEELQDRMNIAMIDFSQRLDAYQECSDIELIFDRVAKQQKEVEKIEEHDFTEEDCLDHQFVQYVIMESAMLLHSLCECHGYRTKLVNAISQALNSMYRSLNKHIKALECIDESSYIEGWEPCDDLSVMKRNYPLEDRIELSRFTSRLFRDSKSNSDVNSRPLPPKLADPENTNDDSSSLDYEGS